MADFTHDKDDPEFIFIMREGMNLRFTVFDFDWHLLPGQKDEMVGMFSIGHNEVKKLMNPENVGTVEKFKTTLLGKNQEQIIGESRKPTELEYQITVFEWVETKNTCSECNDREKKLAETKLQHRLEMEKKTKEEQEKYDKLSVEYEKEQVEKRDLQEVKDAFSCMLSCASFFRIKDAFHCAPFHWILSGCVCLCIDLGQYVIVTEAQFFKYETERNPDVVAER